MDARWGWGGGDDDDIDIDLSAQRAVYCPGCPVQIFCRGGIWPNDITLCKGCQTILRGKERLARCGGSTLKKNSWHGWTKSCNCRVAWTDPGHRGCDGLELT
jgi:hypothetical protein